VAVWTIELPCHTARLNELLRSVKARVRLKKRDRGLVLVACRNVSLPPATGKRRVSLQVTLGSGQRRADPDAWWKSLLDALRHAHAIVDDGPRWCELGPVEYARGRVGMVITLEDLPDAREAGVRPGREEGPEGGGRCGSANWVTRSAARGPWPSPGGRRPGWAGRCCW
jgi:hypothetical protein